MATNIGTQATALLDRVEKFSFIMKDVGHVGTCINGNAYDYQSLFNIVEFMTEMQVEAVSEMKDFIEKHVLPIAAHINAPGAK